MNKLVTCNNCGWVHFPVDKNHVETWKQEWEELCRTKPEDWLENYGIKDRIPPSDKTYYECFRCSNNYKNFRDAVKDDCPDGCTIQPIMNRDE